MGRMNKNRKKSQPEKLEKDMSNHGILFRLILIGIAILVASLAFFAVFSQLLHTEPGWQTIAATTTRTMASREFVFQYHVGGADRKPSEDYNQLNRLYPRLLDRAYMVFDSGEYDGISNLAAVNRHPNEQVQVEPELYSALELLEQLDSRYLYYAPVYAQYRSLFGCDNDWDAQKFDPAVDASAGEYASDVSAFASNPESINLELLGDNTVILHVSQAYLDFASENEITDFLDFFFLQNAFVLDNVADNLIAKGLTAGIISSAEGFSRALGEDDYTVTVCDWDEGSAYPAANMAYNGPMSLIALRSFPLNDQEKKYYYQYEDGSIRNPFVDTQSGLCRSAFRSMLVYDETAGCGELLLKSWDTFVSGVPDVQTLTGQGIDTVFLRDTVIFASDETADFSDFYSDESRTYVVSKTS